MNIEQWQAEYKPIVNHLDENASWQDERGEGSMFETYGEEEKYVYAQPENHVWTYVDGDNGTYLITGRAYVNRIGYFITAKPWTEDFEIQVINDEED